MLFLDVFSYFEGFYVVGMAAREDHINHRIGFESLDDFIHFRETTVVRRHAGAGDLQVPCSQGTHRIVSSFSWRRADESGFHGKRYLIHSGSWWRLVRSLAFTEEQKLYYTL